MEPYPVRTSVRFGELQWNHAEFALGGRGIISGKLGTVGFLANRALDWWIHGKGGRMGKRKR